MIDREIAALLAYAGRLDSRIRRTLADPRQAARTIEEWTGALADLPATRPEVGWDVAHAVRRYYEQHGGNRSAQYRAIEPHDVLATWAPYRAELMNRHTDPLPDADPDDPAAWRAELLATRAAVATGHTPPVQYRPALDPAGQQRVAALLSSADGRPRRALPEHAARQLAPFRPVRAARDAARSDGQPDPLDHPCTWCGAQTDEPCRTGYRRHGKGRGTRATPHPCRVDAATRADQETAE
ncbi:hypothetical protein RKE29_02725 [Streptomyces sp. B1866]|uniref:zinc finger domain-containing protein n=1 Tax=Streptomyces sp. B1866 TaxID=3075431 RepID=UPI00288F0ACC|nr:hypothetical protein [Streptomyces sp. B1866]MDT3395573.1 hypothetical protein [Streptomyces sp. B1866]